MAPLSAHRPSRTTAESLAEKTTPSHRTRDPLIAGALYCAVALIYFHAVLPDFFSAVIGPAEDNLRSLWNLWYGYLAISSDHFDLARTSLIFYPGGTSLLFNDYSFYNLLISVPLQHLFSLPAVYNLLLLHSFVLAGIGAYLLARYVVRDRIIALFAGFLFAFCPTHVAQAAHHLNIASIQFIPFFVLFFVKSLRHDEHHTRNVLLSALFFLLVTLCSWTWGLFSLVLIAAAYLWMAISDRKPIHRRALNVSLASVVPTVILLAPWLLPMITNEVSGNVSMAGGHSIFVADLASLLTPPPFLLAGNADWLESIRSHFTGNDWESIGYIGLVNLLLIAMAIRSRHPARWAIGGGTILFLLLAIGSRPHVIGDELTIPLPFAIFEHIPVFDQLRSPARAMVFVYLGVALLSAIGLKWLADRTRGMRRTWPAILIAALAVVEFSGVINETTAIALPKGYDVVTSDPSVTAIVDIPSSWRGNSRYMMYQTMHRIPIAQGLLPRRTDHALIDNLAFLSPELLRFQLETNQISHIVVHRGIRPETAEPTIERYRPYFPTAYEDSCLVVFRVTPVLHTAHKKGATVGNAVTRGGQ